MSKEKKQKLQGLTVRYWPVLVLTALAVLLIIGSFIVPPTGVVDPSVLAASGEIFAFAALLTFIVRSEAGADVTFRRGDVEIKLDNPDRSELDDMNDMDNLNDLQDGRF